MDDSGVDFAKLREGRPAVNFLEFMPVDPVTREVCSPFVVWGLDVAKSLLTNGFVGVGGWFIDWPNLSGTLPVTVRSSVEFKP